MSHVRLCPCCIISIRIPFPDERRTLSKSDARLTTRFRATGSRNGFKQVSCGSRTTELHKHLHRKPHTRHHGSPRDHPRAPLRRTRSLVRDVSSHAESRWPAHLVTPHVQRRLSPRVRSPLSCRVSELWPDAGIERARLCLARSPQAMLPSCSKACASLLQRARSLRSAFRECLPKMSSKCGSSSMSYLSK